MATINSEIAYINEAKNNLMEALISKFGIPKQNFYLDTLLQNPKRLHDWSVFVTTTNVHTDGSLTFKNDGKGDAAGTTFNGSIDRSISYNSIGAAAANHTHPYLPFNLITANADANSLTNGAWYTGTDSNTTTISNTPNNTSMAIISITPYSASGDVRTAQFAFDANGKAYVRGSRTSNFPWYTVLTTGNSSVSGGGSSWGSSITVNIGGISKTLTIPDKPTIPTSLPANGGNADTASKLSTVSKTAWGLTYWTSGGVPTNISGAISNTGSIIPSEANKSDIGSNSLYYRNGYFTLIGAPSNTTLQLLSNNTSKLTLEKNGDFRPNKSNEYMLGTSSYYWKRAYIGHGGNIALTNLTSNQVSGTMFDTTDTNRGFGLLMYNNGSFGNKVAGMPAAAITLEYTTDGSTWIVDNRTFYNSGDSSTVNTDYIPSIKRTMLFNGEWWYPVGGGFIKNNTAGKPQTLTADAGAGNEAADAVGYGCRVTLDFTVENRTFYMHCIMPYWRIYGDKCDCTIEYYNAKNKIWTTLYTVNLNNVNQLKQVYLDRQYYVDGARVNRETISSTDTTPIINKLRFTVKITEKGAALASNSNARYFPGISSIYVWGPGAASLTSGSTTISGQSSATVFKDSTRMGWTLSRYNVPIYLSSTNDRGSVRIPSSYLYIGDDYQYNPANIAKYATLVLGNNLNINTENAHEEGRIQLYSEATSYHLIRGESTTTAYTHKFPNSSGWIATGGSNGVGDATHPVYLSASGILTKCSDFSLSNHTHSQYLTAHQDISGKVNKSGDTMSGELKSTSGNALRFKNGGYGVILRNDGSDFYFLVTNKDDADGNWNSLRPFKFNLATGVCNISGNISGNATTANLLNVMSNNEIKINSNGSSLFDTDDKSNVLHINYSWANSTAKGRVLKYDFRDGQKEFANVQAATFIGAFDGTLQSSNDITIADGDKLVVTDSSDSNKIKRTSVTFDGSSSSKALTLKGTWETFNNYTLPTQYSNTIPNEFEIKINKINAPTSSSGTTYGTGNNGLVLKSNGTTVYWASDSNTLYYLTLNGTTTGTSGGNNLGTIYAPTTVGTANLILKSNGSGAPTWINLSSLQPDFAKYLQGWNSTVSSTNNYPYHRILHIQGTGSYADKSITLYISQGYQGGRFGIIRITLRSNDLTSTKENETYCAVEAKWLVRVGFALDLIKIGVNNIKANWNADIYYKSNGTYASIYCTVLDEGSRGAKGETWERVFSYETSKKDANSNYVTDAHLDCYNSESSLYTAYNVALANSTEGRNVRIWAGASGTAVNSATTTNPYIKVGYDDAYKTQIQLVGGSNTTVKSDDSGKITISTTSPGNGALTLKAGSLQIANDFTANASSGITYNIPLATLVTNNSGTNTYGVVKGCAEGSTNSDGWEKCKVVDGVIYYYNIVSNETLTLNVGGESVANNNTFTANSSQSRTYNVPVMTTSAYGVAKVWGVDSSNSRGAAPGTTDNRFYGVGKDKDGKLYVNVPWTNTTYSVATTSSNGLMSSSDKAKLDGITSGANNYSLPTASDTTLGGVKIGYSSSGKNYAVQLDSSKMYVNVPWTDTKVTLTKTDENANRYIPFGSDTGTQTLKINSGFTINPGSETTDKTYTYLRIGNSINAGVKGNKSGGLCLYSNTSNYAVILTVDSYSSNFNFYLPNVGGILGVRQGHGNPLDGTGWSSGTAYIPLANSTSGAYYTSSGVRVTSTYSDVEGSSGYSVITLGNNTATTANVANKSLYGQILLYSSGTTYGRYDADSWHGNSALKAFKIIGKQFENTGDTDNFSYLELGNATKEGTKGASEGALKIFGSQDKYINIRYKGTSNNLTFYFRNHSATDPCFSVATLTESAIGSSTLPIYVNSNGVLQACTGTSTNYCSPGAYTNVYEESNIALLISTASTSNAVVGWCSDRITPLPGTELDMLFDCTMKLSNLGGDVSIGLSPIQETMGGQISNMINTSESYSYNYGVISPHSFFLNKPIPSNLRNGFYLVIYGQKSAFQSTYKIEFLKLRTKVVPVTNLNFTNIYTPTINILEKNSNNLYDGFSVAQDSFYFRKGNYGLAINSSGIKILCSGFWYNLHREDDGTLKLTDTWL